MFELNTKCRSLLPIDLDLATELILNQNGDQFQAQ